MSRTPSELVGVHREHFLRRKLTRSPLLNFMPSSSRIDATALFSGVTPNTLATQGFGVTTASGMLLGLMGTRGEAKIVNANSSTIRKIKAIKTKSDDEVHSTGQHSLFIGYPCIIIPDEKDKTTKFAPLFLIPIEISTSGNDITLRRKVENGTTKNAFEFEEVKFNSLLAAFIKLLDNIDLPKEISYELDSDNFSEIKNDVLKRWHTLSQKYDFPEVEAAPSKSVLKALTRENSDPQLYASALIGCASFAGAALLDDLTEIEKLLKNGATCSIPLQRLLSNGLSTEEHDAVYPTTDEDKWLVEKSDPYQEKAVWTQRVAPLMVLQGPPGTGKSQTIVNLVADAVAHKRSVLVVCEKKDAFEVIKKRMNGAGIGELANLVKDISPSRLPTIKFIKKINENYEDKVSDENDRQRYSEKIIEFENILEKLHKALNEDLSKKALPYRQIKSKLNFIDLNQKVSIWDSNLVALLTNKATNNYSAKELKEDVFSIQKFTTQAKKLNYPENIWSEISETLDEITIAEIKSNVSELYSLCKNVSTGQLVVNKRADNLWISAHKFITTNKISDVVSSHLFVSPDAYANNKNFDNIYKLIFNLKNVKAKIKYTDEIKKTLTPNYELNTINTIVNDTSDLREINEILEEIKSSKLYSLLNKTLLTELDSWHMHVEAIILHHWLEKIIASNSQGFSRILRAEDFRDELSYYVNGKRSLDTKNILSKFTGRVEARDFLGEHALLREKKSTGIPNTSLRHLYTKGAQQINAIMPVLLTRPEVASSILPLEANIYDLVVIDEASQMYVAEAIPMLFRAKSALIAGDTQQMPPSNQFSFNANDDEDEYEDEDDTDELVGESPVVSKVASADGEFRLLVAADGALGAKSPHKVTLNVHYRSARKELIDFSNHAFYEGKLIIPSGNAALAPFMQTAITFEQVRGDFDKGINEAEARRIVDWLDEIWSMQVSSEERFTVGVVVNNVRQKARVEELIRNQCEIDRRFADCYAQEQDRKTEDGEDVSLFVRSVESVQGDERDIIIFGFTYSGSSRRFGPLVTPKLDGRKRLNVAITRAKRGMIVLNSLDIEHISNDSEKETAERYFVYQYLRYAKAVSECSESTVNSILNQLNPERQRLALIEQETDSPFEDEVKAFIETLGFVVKPQVGESGFRIDLGVKLALFDLNYLCGIECDGARYHSGWTARTRDVWRQEILESKGWKILRVWSTTWFEKPEVAREQLKESLNQLKIDALLQVAPQATTRVFAAITSAVISPITARLPTVQNGVYFSVTLDKCEGDFYSTALNAKITEQLQRIVETESPVLEEVVFEKIARAWRLGRTGSTIKERLKKLTPTTVQRCYEYDNLFLCSADCDFENFADFRGCNDEAEGSKRNISELCNGEIYAGVLYFKKLSLYDSDDEIANSVCRHIGMKRVTEAAKERVLNVIKRYVH